MLALVAALVIAQAPDPGEGAPSPDFSACLALLQAGEREGAQACYAARAAEVDVDEREAALARELADVVSSLRLTVPDEELQVPAPLPSNLLDPGTLVSSGKAELVLWTALSGAFAAEMTAWTMLMATNGFGSNAMLVAAAILLSPVGGGLAGLAAGAGAVLALPELSAGDANVARAFLLLGIFDAITLGFSSASLGIASVGSGAPTFAAMVLVQTLAAGLGAAATLLDLPEGAGAAAISGALWGSVLTVLVANMADAFKGDARFAPLTVSLAGNLGFVAGGALASTVLPLSRAETWAVDVGGAVGLLGGAALAFGMRAPNPALGYGTMAIGCAGGMVAGGAAARFVPPLVDSLPELVAVSPLMVPAVDGSAPPVGLALGGRF